MFLTFKADGGSALYVSEDSNGGVRLEDYIRVGTVRSKQIWARTLNAEQVAELHAYLSTVVKP